MFIKNQSQKKIMKVFLGADHAGFRIKEKIKKYFEKNKISYDDLGTFSTQPCDYPEYALKVAKKVAKQKQDRGILICGTGTGMVIAANKVKGIRAIAAYDAYSAKMSRFDNDANILCLRGRKFPYAKIKKIVNIWLKTPFSKEKRHKKRINKITKYEK